MTSFVEFPDSGDNFKQIYAGSKDDPEGSDDDNTEFQFKVKPYNLSKKKTEDDEEEIGVDEDEDVNNDDDDEDEDEDEDDDDDENDDEDDILAGKNKVNSSSGENTGKNKFESFISDDEDDNDDNDDDDDENEDEDYLQKFNSKMKQNNISENHPELIMRNNDEVDILAKIVRDENGVIIDPLHRTLPFLSKYEKARILGEASRQIDCGRQPYIQLEEGIIDSYVIASRELELKRIPFIIRRPLPNGACEYWKLSDLEFINE